MFSCGVDCALIILQLNSPIHTVTFGSALTFPQNQLVGWVQMPSMHAFVDSKPKVKVFIPMYEPLEVTKCNRITAKQLVYLKKRESCLLLRLSW